MVATTMLSTTYLINKIKNDFPQFEFLEGNDFFWHSKENRIYYCIENDECIYLIIHEISHALLNHANYQFDIELITKEREAWDLALQIAKEYHLSIPKKIIQSNLDSYRNWMHARSTCPNCKAVGVQNSPRSYSCPICRHLWSVNEAKKCNLKRLSQ